MAGRYNEDALLEGSKQFREKTMAKYYTTQNPRILSVKKITVVFRWQKVRMRWRLAKKIPEEDSELKVFQHRSLVRMRPATLVLSCHHLQMKRITHPVQSYKCGNTVEIMDLNVRIAKENLMRRAT